MGTFRIYPNGSYSTQLGNSIIDLEESYSANSLFYPVGSHSWMRGLVFRLDDSTCTLEGNVVFGLSEDDSLTKKRFFAFDLNDKVFVKRSFKFDSNNDVFTKRDFNFNDSLFMKDGSAFDSDGNLVANGGFIFELDDDRFFISRDAVFNSEDDFLKAKKSVIYSESKH